MARKKFGHKNTICCICGSSETYVYHGEPKWYKYYDKKGNWDEKSWLCNKCYMKIQNDLPDSHKNLRKELCSEEKLSIKIESGTGILGECIVANVLGIRNCDNCSLSKHNYNWSSLHDLEKDNKKIQIKIRIPWYGQYSFAIGEIHNFDILYILCMRSDAKIIRRVYVIPEIYISELKGITIYEESSTGDRYEEFRVEDIKLYDDAHNNIMNKLKNCKLLKD